MCRIPKTSVMWMDGLSCVTVCNVKMMRVGKNSFQGSHNTYKTCKNDVEFSSDGKVGCFRILSNIMNEKSKFRNSLNPYRFKSTCKTHPPPKKWGHSKYLKKICLEISLKILEMEISESHKTRIPEL